MTLKALLQCRRLKGKYKHKQNPVDITFWKVNDQLVLNTMRRIVIGIGENYLFTVNAP